MKHLKKIYYVIIIGSIITCYLLPLQAKACASSWNELVIEIGYDPDDQTLVRMYCGGGNGICP